MTRARSSRREGGMTLIEVMVSVLLASILTAGVFNMMIGQTRNYDTQLKATIKQENLWAAMEYLQRQVRMAGFGFGGCPNGVIEEWDGTSAFRNTTQVALQVFDDCSLFEDSSVYPPGSPGPVTLASCTVRNGTDSFAVLYSSEANTAGLGLINILDHKGTNIKASSCGEIADNDYLALWDPSSPTPCLMVQATKDATMKKDCKIQINSSSNPNPAAFKAKFGKDGFPPGSVVLRLGAGVQIPRKFAIDSSKQPPRLVTWTDNKVNAETVAEGIEDMQISFACDINPKDGVLTETPGSPDEWAYNTVETWTGLGGDLAPSTCGTGANIMAVRITLVARSIGPEAGVKGLRPAIENHAAGGADNYARAVLTSTVKPRNIMRMP